MYRLVFTNQALKDAKKASSGGFKPRIEELLEVLKANPFQPPYEKLVGDLSDAYSRRINIQHRLVYQVYGKARVVKVIRMWTHYE
jgi:toxin YoeB